MTIDKGKGRVYDCPFCSRIVILCDATCTVYHDEPACEPFAARMLALGLKTHRESFTVVATVAVDRESN